MAIFDVIEYEGDSGTLVWRHPCRDFNTGSQLVVHQSQEAVFLKNGRVLDLFGPGRYPLSTDNLPLLSALVNLPFGGQSPFHCEIYFINKTEQMSIKWGTDSKLEYLEPTYRFPIQLGACGELSLRVNNTYKFLTRLVRTENAFTLDTLSQYFRVFVVTKAKAYLARYMRESGVSIFEIDEHLTELSDYIKELLIPDFAAYGLSLERFFILALLKPEDDPSYVRFRQSYRGQDAGSPQRPAAGFCANCGRPLDAPGNFCPACGAKRR